MGRPPPFGGHQPLPDPLAQLLGRRPAERDEHQLRQLSDALGDVPGRQRSDRVGLARAGARLEHSSASRQRAAEVERRDVDDRRHADSARPPQRLPTADGPARRTGAVVVQPAPPAARRPWPFRRAARRTAPDPPIPTGGGVGLLSLVPIARPLLFREGSRVGRGRVDAPGRVLGRRLDGERKRARAGLASAARPARSIPAGGVLVDGSKARRRDALSPVPADRHSRPARVRMRDGQREQLRPCPEPVLGRERGRAVSTPPAPRSRPGRRRRCRPLDGRRRRRRRRPSGLGRCAVPRSHSTSGSTSAMTPSTTRRLSSPGGQGLSSPLGWTHARASAPASRARSSRSPTAQRLSGSSSTASASSNSSSSPTSVTPSRCRRNALAAVLKECNQVVESEFIGLVRRCEWRVEERTLRNAEPPARIARATDCRSKLNGRPSAPSSPAMKLRGRTAAVDGGRRHALVRGARPMRTSASAASRISPWGRRAAAARSSGGRRRCRARQGGPLRPGSRRAELAVLAAGSRSPTRGSRARTSSPRRLLCAGTGRRPTRAGRRPDAAPSASAPSSTWSARRCGSWLGWDGRVAGRRAGRMSARVSLIVTRSPASSATCASSR